MKRGAVSASLDVAALFAPVAGHAVLGLAVSGGADSLALMILAARWADAATPSKRLVVYTVDHGLRAEAKAETAHVCALATQLGLECRVLRWTGAKSATGIQAAARAARYGLIGAAMAEDGAEILLTAHHMQDQAETVLMRLAHGSGLAGLGGMRAFSRVEEVALFRPLLKVSKKALDDEVRTRGFVAVEDPSNADENYERVRWRKIAGPLADLGLDAEALALFATRAGRADAALRTMTTQHFEQLADIDGLGVVRLDLAVWRDLAAELQVRLLQMALRMVGGDFKPFGLSQIEKLVADLANESAFAKMTLMGCVVVRTDRHVEVGREVSRIDRQNHRLLPGDVLVWDRRFAITNRMDTAVLVAPGTSLTKNQAADFLGHENFAARHVHAAPMVMSPQGEVLALGANTREAKVLVEFIGPQRLNHAPNALLNSA